MENIYFSTIKMVLVLAAMVFGIIVFYRYMGKWKLKLNLGPGKGGYGLQKVETIHLGYRKFVSVVEVRDRVLVIGVGDKEMSLLTDWKKGEEQA
ncbi:MAG: Flagellar biosynthesis protein, FliO [Syntrophorhabdaceae bacterium PtaU1.Bin034]|nr:MAG: Flagellar biosynthesis protein, FliO [Syntrophorhabdaceae bacterium PtaU1.Bin034]